MKKSDQMGAARMGNSNPKTEFEITRYQMEIFTLTV